MTHDELIEAVAKAIFACHFADTAEAQAMMQKDWSRPSPLMTMVHNEARAAIRVIAPVMKRALRERDQAVEALKTTDAWLDQWARHIGDCPGSDWCECGLTRARYEAETTLASIEGAGHE